MSEDKEEKTRARSFAENPWVQILAPAALSICGVLLLGWQQAAVMQAHLAQLETDSSALEAKVSALEVRIGQIDRAQMSLEAQTQSSKEQIAQMRDTMIEVRNYHAATMKEVRDLSVQMARIEGAIKKEKR